MFLFETYRMDGQTTMNTAQDSRIRDLKDKKVRDLTSAPRRLPIEIEGTVAFEMILTMWQTLDEGDGPSEIDLGPEGKVDIPSLVPKDLHEEITAIGGPHYMAWLAIAGLFTSAPHPHSPENLTSWLESIDDHRLRRHALGHFTHSADMALIEQVASGDTTKIPDLFDDLSVKHPEKAEFLTWLVTTEGMPQRYATAYRRFREEVMAPYEETLSGAIGRAAAARRAAPVRGSARDVVEDVTAGIDFEIPMGVSRVVLVPTVVIRPLSLLVGHRETLIVYYGVADEFIESDPEAPPSWLVNTFKALADEKRLRIMRQLKTGAASLDDLAGMLGVSKSTVHHHISLLRGAGLIRVRVNPEEKGHNPQKYTLRPQGLDHAADFLGDYLGTSESETNAS